MGNRSAARQSPRSVQETDAAHHRQCADGRARLSDCDLLLFATHGPLDGQSPFASSLVLAGTGELTVAELVGLHVGSRLAVLSACDTGRGTATLGGDLIGLTRALLGKKATAFAGLVIGYGVKENIEEAYKWLMYTWRPGDRIFVFVFGFSRGAYTARALVGLLRTVGLLRAGADNLIPYALKLYTKSGEKNPTKEQEKRYWAERDDFTRKFGNPEFPNAFAKTQRQVHFLGVWDTVKSVGWFNWRARWQQAHWPFTRKAPNVEHGRHALAIDERRAPYREYRFGAEELNSTERRLREVWFAGVHSDVGGKYPEHGLSDIALDWLVREAASAGLLLDERRYARGLDVAMGHPLPPEKALDPIHTNPWYWWFAGFHWHTRQILAGDEVHPSVLRRIELTADAKKPYRPPIPPRQPGATDL